MADESHERWVSGRTIRRSCHGARSVPCQDPDWGYIQKFYEDGYTAGCGGGLYCPDSSVQRQQMAVFLLKGEHGPSYTPPSCMATLYNDEPCPGGPNVDWVNQLTNGSRPGAGTGTSARPTRSPSGRWPST